MPESYFERFRIRVWVWIVPLIILCSGCHLLKGRIFKAEEPDVPRIEKMVVVGFKPALSPWEEPNMVRSPFSGTVFMAEPVSERVTSQMTAELFERISKGKGYDLVSPAQARGVYQSLLSSDQVLGDIELARRIGQAFSADGVLMGYMYRWTELDLTIDRPASVAFDLYLIGPKDGAILWKGKYDKTQRPLTENLLDMHTFIKGGGRWMRVSQLAKLGLDDLLSKFPRGERRGEG